MDYVANTDLSRLKARIEAEQSENCVIFYSAQPLKHDSLELNVTRYGKLEIKIRGRNDRIEKKIGR